jgi:hypothetical protein
MLSYSAFFLQKPFAFSVGRKTASFETEVEGQILTRSSFDFASVLANCRYAQDERSWGQTPGGEKRTSRPHVT